MEQTPKVSVIIPVYNAEKYLRQCLDSVVNQTLREIEIICVDDGSTDGSLAILREYESADNRVKVLTQKNQGAGAARNTGMSAASGKYFDFLDADDFLDVSALLRLVSKASETGADIVIHDADFYNEDSDEFTSADWLLNHSFLPKDTVFSKQTIPDTLFQVVAGGPCNKLYLKSFIISQNVRFPNMRSLEDVPFVYTALALANRIACVDSVLAHYRRSEGKQGLVSQIDRHPERIFESYRILKDNLNDKNLYQLLERTFINRATSDFIDQYKHHIIKDQDSLEYYKLYLSNIASVEFELRDKPASYFYNKNLYCDLMNLFSSTNSSCDASDIAVDPAVSIIIPCYNSSLYIRQCINSVLRQTLRTFQLILVDDGSTDDTLSILNSYKAIDPRVTVLTQENKFAGAARNYGMSIATGRYLLFLDSDDYFDNSFVEKLYRKALHTDADITICDGYYFDNRTHEISSPSVLLQQANLPRKKTFCYKDIPDKILHISIDCPWNKLFNREFIQKNDLSFQNTRSANDIYFVDAALLLADKISIVNERLVFYRRNIKTSLQANRDKEPLNFYQALTAVRSRMESEVRYSSIYKSLLSLFIAACRYHLNNAKNKNTFLFLFNFYKTTAFDQWQLNGEDQSNFIFPADKSWVTSVLQSNAEEYMQSHSNLPFMKPAIIISLTSYPARIPYVAKVIESIKCQTVKPDKILLWLAESQFENKEKDLPPQLLAQLGEDVELRWCEDIKPHKKYYYAMQEYPDSILITIDDDICYDSQLVEGLLASYLKYPYAVSAMRAHLITFENGAIAPYKNWKREIDQVGVPSYALCATGVGGVLYPPHCLTQEAFNLDAIKQTCLNADDLWLKVMEIISGVPVVVARKPQKLNYIDGSQDVALWKNNDTLGANDPQLASILNKYDALGGMDTVTQRLHISFENFDAAAVSGSAAHRVSRIRENDAEESRLIRASWSYRIGRFITWIPRKVRGFFRCYREHGWYYTRNRLLFHLHLKQH